MNKLSDSVLQRLIYIKYLLYQANNQRGLPRPFSSTAILSLHDLVEIYFQLANEKLELYIKKPNAKILETYHFEINKYLIANKSQTISNQYIKKLNELRNQLKHTSIFIDDTDIKSLYEESERLIKTFTPLIFDLHLEDVSMAELINDKIIKKYMIEAESQIMAKDFDKALVSLAKAFCEYEGQALDYRDRFGIKMHSPYTPKPDLPSNFMNITDHNIKKTFEGSFKIMRKIISELEKEIISIKKVILLGYDVKSYFIFKQIAPFATKIASLNVNNQYDIRIEVYNVEELKKEHYSIEQLRFCFDFVFDSVIREQEIESMNVRNIQYKIMLERMNQSKASGTD
ncbi:MAG: hypothetical protein IPJ09_03240 [Saprospiraceae bacterium]|nr:hypothetical protein [Saprospiraceae bacterium]